MDDKIDVLILGAGPAGLTAGYRLSTADKSICIVDKCDRVGGLAKTLKHNDCLCDIGPHILCSREYVYDFNSDMYSFIQSLLGDELYEYESSNQLYLESVQVNSDKYKYPVSIMNAVSNIGFGKSIKIGLDYIHAKSSSAKCDNYESSLYSSLGKKLSDLFLINIGKKTWGMPCNRMSADVAWRVGDFSIFDVLKKQFKNVTAVMSRKGNPVNYPKHGMGVICDRLKEEIDKSEKSSCMPSSTPQNIIIKNNSIVSANICLPDNTIETIYPQYVVSSIPLLDLLNSFSPQPPSDVINAAKSLRCRSHICVYLIFNSQSILKEHCIYFADPSIPFARMMEQNHYSENMIPSGKTVLGIEYFCWFDDNVWKLTDDELRDQTMKQLKNLSVVNEQVLSDFFVHRERDAYPAYELGYAEHLNIVKNYLAEIDNLKIIGRVGSFSYIGQYKAMQMGWDVAIDLIANKSGDNK